MATPVVDAPLYVKGGSIIPLLIPEMVVPATTDDSVPQEAVSAAAVANGGLSLLVALDHKAAEDGTGAAAAAAAAAAGEIFLDDFKSLKTVERGQYLHATFIASGSKLIANVTHAAPAALTAASKPLRRDIHSVDTVTVWGVAPGAVSKVRLSVAGGAAVALPRKQWEQAARGQLRVTGLVGATLLVGAGEAFVLSW